MFEKISPEIELDYLFENSDTAICYTDSDGKFIKVNSAYANLFSISKEELIGKDISIHFSDLESKTKNLQSYKSFFLGGINGSREVSIFNHSGELKTIEITSKFFQVSEHLKLCVSFINDITKYRNSNEKILNAIFNALSGVIYHSKFDSSNVRKLVFMSEGSYELFGYSNQELQNNISLIATVLHPDDMISPSESLEIFRKNNNFRRLEYRVKNKQGGWRWLEERSILIESGNDQYNIYGMITDVSDIKLNRKLLEDLRFAMDRSVIISITDSEGTIIEINENFSKVSGYERNEILGKNHRMINSGYHSKEFFSELWDTILSGEVWEGDIRNKRKDGTFYWVHSFIIPLLDEKKKPFQFISIRHEITARKEAENKLAASEEKYRLLFENAPIGISIVNSDGVILDCNTYISNIMGFTKEELIGKSVFEFIHEDFVEFKKIALEKLFGGDAKRFYIEEKRKTKDGNYVWIGCYSNAISDDTGKIVYRLDFVTDIENIKRSEEELLKLDSSKNTILNIVAHDLRNPLSGILNLVRLLLKKEKDDECQKYLELIEDSSKHSMAIIQDILDISRLEQEVTLDDTETTELNDFLKNCIYFQNLQAKTKHIQINYKSSIDKIYHEINRDMMKRVFSNLISNAIKFSQENAQIEIILYRVSQKTIIQIKDYGIGIPEKMIPVLFEKFSEARRLGTKGEHSIGLGLSIVKEIIDKHRANIRIESEENKGTSIYIEL